MVHITTLLVQLDVSSAALENIMLIFVRLFVWTVLSDLEVLLLVFPNVLGALLAFLLLRPDKRNALLV